MSDRYGNQPPNGWQGHQQVQGYDPRSAYRAPQEPQQYVEKVSRSSWSSENVNVSLKRQSISYFTTESMVSFQHKVKAYEDQDGYTKVQYTFKTQQYPYGQ